MKIKLNSPDNEAIRKYHVAYKLVGGCVDAINCEEVELLPNEKCNYDTFYEKINSTLNKYNGYIVGTIISWSLIED